MPISKWLCEYVMSCWCECICAPGGMTNISGISSILVVKLLASWDPHEQQFSRKLIPLPCSQWSSRSHVVRICLPRESWEIMRNPNVLVDLLRLHPSILPWSPGFWSLASYPDGATPPTLEWSRWPDLRSFQLMDSDWVSERCGTVWFHMVP